MKRGFLEKLIERIGLVQPGDVQNYLVEIAREKGFLETIFNAILEGVMVTDPSGRLIYLNRSAAGFFGIEVEPSLGRHLNEVVKGLDFQQIALSNEIVSRDLEVFYPENRLLNFYTVPLTSEDSPEEVVGRAIILRDITQNRRMTEETIESERFSALTLLAAGVAHEIGNPLNSLDIHLQLMERRIKKMPARSQGQFADSVSVARQEVARLDHIITQFLRAIRPQPLTPKPEHLNGIVQETISFLEPEILDRDIIVEMELAEGLPAISIDRDQLKQAFYNIIRNSIQAMNSGGILRVHTGMDQTHQFARFMDTGGGISSEAISRVFEPYFTTKSSGTGLGLLIVRRIVRAHGGEVILESAQGKGLTLTVRLPRADRHVRFLEQGSSGQNEVLPPNELG